MARGDVVAALSGEHNNNPPKSGILGAQVFVRACVQRELARLPRAAAMAGAAAHRRGGRRHLGRGLARQALGAVRLKSRQQDNTAHGFTMPADS